MSSEDGIDPGAVEEHGPADGVRVVLVHGSPDRRGAFRRGLPHLADLRVVTYDRRGYGDSAWLSPPRSLADHAADLVRVLDGRRAVVVGHSYGANVAMSASTAVPELIVSLGLWEPSMCWLPGWPPDHIEQVRAMATVADTDTFGERMGRLFLGDERWEGLDDEARTRYRREGLAISRDMSFILDVPPYDVQAVKAPAVVGVGGRTTEPHRVGAHLLAEALGVSRVAYPDATHMVHVQAPADWASFVRLAVAAAS